MNNKEIRMRLERAVNEMPVDLFQSIQDAPVKKMDKHDSITEQRKGKITTNFLKPVTFGFSFIFILVLGLAGWYQYFLSADSYIYFDINPGIKIVTNRQNQVIELIGINQQGKEIVEATDYKRKDLALVQKSLLDQFMERGLLQERQVMLISALNKNKNKSEAIVREFDRGVHEYFENQDLKLVVLRQVLENSNTLEEFAENYQISMGKITFIRNLMILNPDFILEELVGLSLEQLLMLSLETGLNLDKIIDSNADYEKILITDFDDDLEPESELEPTPQPESELEPAPTLVRVSERKAIEIALNEVGGGVVVEFKFDFEDGEYEITIYFDGYEYEIEMDAYTGSIKEIDIDELDDDDWSNRYPNKEQLIGINRAKEIAIGRVGGGRIEEIELEEDDGRLIYEVEVKYSGVKYELEIDAYTGEILSFDIDD